MGMAYKNLTVKSDVSRMPVSKSGFDLECGAFCADLKKKRFKVDRIPPIDRMFEKNTPMMADVQMQKPRVNYLVPF